MLPVHQQAGCWLAHFATSGAQGTHYTDWQQVVHSRPHHPPRLQARIAMSHEHYLMFGDEPDAKRVCPGVGHDDSGVQGLLSLKHALEQLVDPQDGPSGRDSESPPTTHKVRSPSSHRSSAAESEAWKLAGRAPPPEQLQLDEQKKDDTLNTSPLFCPVNFKSKCPNERGRGAFAAAALCLLERSGVAQGHVYAVRSGQHVDRWLLNRMPGRTQALLAFVNGVVVSD